MKELQQKRWEKELEKLNMGFPEALIFICDMIDVADSRKKIEVDYTKNYFANYYGVDVATFNKWVQNFCPDLWNEGYKKKRKFSKNDVIRIYASLGRYSFKEKIPRNHKEVSDFIYLSTTWGKSKKYQELALELEDKLSNREARINILPPKRVTEILAEVVEDSIKYKDQSTEEEKEHYEERIKKAQFLISRFGSMTEHQMNVRKRALRIWFASSKTDQMNLDD